MLGLLPALNPEAPEVLSSCKAILDCQIDFTTLFRTLNLLQNLLLNNQLTPEHPKALNIYAQSVLQVIGRESDQLQHGDYKHLFMDLIFKL